MPTNQPSIQSGRNRICRKPRSESVFEVVVLGEGGVGRRTAPKERPDAVHRVHVRCMRGQLHDAEPVVCGGVVAHPCGPGRIGTAPDQDDGDVELEVGAHDQVAVGTPGERKETQGR
ncbi:hypothetical protein GCM10023080_093520 [Streptomyces pseudoechinosporeus]